MLPPLTSGIGTLFDHVQRGQRLRRPSQGSPGRPDRRHPPSRPHRPGRQATRRPPGPQPKTPRTRWGFRVSSMSWNIIWVELRGSEPLPPRCERASPGSVGDTVTKSQPPITATGLAETARRVGEAAARRRSLVARLTERRISIAWPNTPSMTLARPSR
jgi:hypothetical protein